jgi:hemerythrin-like domain-containing protein
MINVIALSLYPCYHSGKLEFFPQEACMKLTDTLKDEHQVILLVLDAAARQAHAIQAGDAVDTRRVGQMVDFFRSFADRYHHAKEENLLFTRMHERGMSLESGPLAVMLHEHVLGRQHVTAVADAIPAAEKRDPAAVAAIGTQLLVFVELLRAHIAKEDDVLFPMADQLLVPQDQEDLARAFEEAETGEMADVRERYARLAHMLAR